MAAVDRIFVLVLTAEQADQTRRSGLQRFVTQVARSTDSPASGRFSVLVEPAERGVEWRVFGVAVLESGGRGSSFHRRLRARSVIPLPEGLIDEHTLARDLASSGVDVLVKAIRRQAGELTEARSAPLFAALRRYAPEAVDAVRAAMSSHDVDPGSRERWQQEADAIRLALRAGGLDAELPEWRPPASEQPFLAGLVGEPHEATLLDNDMRIPGWDPITLPGVRPDIRTFSSRDRRMEILNANATRAEHGLGVDLIYYLVPTSSLVLVQYKKIVGESCDINARFEGQLDRMRRVAKLGKDATGPSGYRLGPRTSCFVKLAHAREFDPTTDSMMKGMYLPLDLVDLLRAAGERSLGYRTVDRHLNNTQFISLLSDGWIGTTGVNVADLNELAAETLRSGRSLVLAADSGGPSIQRRWGGRG